MRIKKTPPLILYKSLINPLESTENSLKDIKEIANSKSVDGILLHGLLVLSLSKFETMLSETLGYLLKKIPEKLDFKDVKITKEELLSGDLIANKVEEKINTLMYSRIDVLISSFIEITSINSFENQDQLHRLIELKETRNLLVHNELKVNNQYLDKCKGYKRGNGLGSILKVDKIYFNESIDLLLKFVLFFKAEIEKKYSKFTKVKLFEDLWDYIFSSPVLEFGDYWIIDKDIDDIFMQYSDYEGSISHSEKMFLGIWRSHYNGNADYLAGFNMTAITDKAKVYFLLDVLGEIRLGSSMR